MRGFVRSATLVVRQAARRRAAVGPTWAAVLLVGLAVLAGARYWNFSRLALAAVLLGLASAPFRWLPGWRAMRRLAARRRLAIAMVGAVALLVCIALSARRLPQPAVHDEFSYLLAADTFASGRLSNPTHPFWQHFESFHIIHQPTYASKYPPGQGLALAAGQVLTGVPIAGVWASFALACAATCWMLQGWTRPRWALLGGLMGALHPSFHGGLGPGVVGYESWTQTYWGGAVAMLGGALLFGALPRIWRRQRMTYGLVMGLGLAVLANTRPYEGLVASVPVGLVLLARPLRPWPRSARAAPVKVLAPMAAVLGLSAAAMGYYNWRVTGRPLVMPQQVHEMTYAAAPSFLWESPGPVPEYRHVVMRRLHVDLQRRKYTKQLTAAGLLEHYRLVLGALYGFFVASFIMPLLMLPLVLRSGPMRFAALTCLLVLTAVLLTQGAWPHYLAPVTALYLLLVTEGLRHLWVLRLGWLWVGRAAAIATIAFAVLSTAWFVACSFWITESGWWLDRSRLAAVLEAAEGKHLVIVSYSRSEHNPNREWVYNRADIDRAHVVWAREMGPARDAELLRYFRDRQAWLLQADARPPKLSQIIISTPHK
jgi:hypothetical protein